MKPRVLILDCTGSRRSAGPWFRAALAKCGEVDFRAAVPEDGPGALGDADALIISGSPRDAFDNDVRTQSALDFATAAIDRGMPVLGVCYGHQLLGRLAGAQVERNPAGWEVGECVVRSTGELSPLGLTGEMRVLESHQDHVVNVPSGCRLLATNERTQIQAAQWGPDVYGVQFHPEFTGPILRHVWEPRREVWRGRTDFDLDAKLDAAEECKDGLAVLRAFLEILPRS